MVLRTTFRTASGVVSVTDAMVFMPLERGHGIGQRAPHVRPRPERGGYGQDRHAQRGVKQEPQGPAHRRSLRSPAADPLRNRAVHCRAHHRPRGG